MLLFTLLGILSSMTQSVRVTEKKIRSQLELVMDPEMNISIVDIGLIYKVSMSKDKKIHILMTLTSMGCPLFGVIEEDIYFKLSDIGINRKDVKIEMTFEPPWDMTRMSPRARAILGI